MLMLPDACKATLLRQQLQRLQLISCRSEMLPPCRRVGSCRASSCPRHRTLTSLPSHPWLLFVFPMTLWLSFVFPIAPWLTSHRILISVFPQGTTIFFPWFPDIYQINPWQTSFCLAFPWLLYVFAAIPFFWNYLTKLVKYNFVPLKK